MQVERFFKNDYVLCKRWEALVDKYEKESYQVDLEFDIEYPDAKITVSSKAELHDTLLSRGEPNDYRACLYVKRGRNAPAAT